MLRRVISAIVRYPPGGAASTGQLDGLRYFVRRAANGYESVVSKVRPDFVGVGKVKRFARIPAETLGFMYHLALAQTDNYKTPIRFSRNKETLTFHIHRYVVHVAFGGQRNRLD